jgi:hypothetical protein
MANKSSKDGKHRHNRFIQLKRTDATNELLKDKNAFVLLTVIALRARRTAAFNTHNLAVGEALIGDHGNYGMSRQEYRTAKAKLKKWKFATIKTTSKGTIAKLLDNDIYDINAEGQQPPKQPSSNHQATTNNNGKKANNGKYIYTDEDLQLAKLLYQLIREHLPNLSEPNLKSWANDIRKLREIDRRTPEQIEAVFRWSQSDSFWSGVCLSAVCYRKKKDGVKRVDRIETQMRKEKNGSCKTRRVFAQHSQFGETIEA